MSEWNTTTLPDFTVYGFHTGKQLEYRLKDGTEHVGIYQGWGVFGTGEGRQDVIAWRLPPPPEGSEGR